MARITQIKDRTVRTCTGAAAAVFEVEATMGEQQREYRIREWAYTRVWQLQVLAEGGSGAAAGDYEDLGEFASKEEAIAHIEGLPES